jgi:uncharacterized protein
MRALTIKFLLAAALICGAAAPAWADFDDGLTAYYAGDYATALKGWLPLAEQGDAFAQNALGTMYDNGDGVPENDAEAVKWYRLAAEQGIATAQNNLGTMYAAGTGIPLNYIKAYMWYSLAKAQGNERAAENVDGIKQQMTADQIAEAQRLAAEWWEVHQ